MTQEEAIERLECMKFYMRIEEENTGSKFLDEDYEANAMAISALEKQIPIEAYETFNDDTCLYKHYECPSCGDRLSRHASNCYCMKCGQLIKWE